MSSHHFVTENQASALYIGGRNIDNALLAQLLEWNPVIIADVSVADWLLSMDVRIDYLAADGSELFSLPYRVESCARDEWQQLAREILEAGKAGRLAIVGMSTAAAGELVSQLDDIPVIAWTGDARIFRLAKGAVFRKWVGAGYGFAVRPEAHAWISGKTKRTAGGYMTVEDGWILVQAMGEVVFLEFL